MSNLLGPFQFSTLRHPELLWLLLAIVPLFLAECFARAPGVIAISTGETVARIRGRSDAYIRRSPAVFRAVGLALLIVALARPLQGLSPRYDRTDVIDIMLCVDVSGSMRATDYEYRGQMFDRLSVTKAAVAEFIRNRKATQDDRYGMDRLGLILYAGYAWTQAPLTLDYDVLQREVELATVDETDRRKQGTAIGSALGLAVSRLRKSEAKSKVIVLLTDGLNNAGELDPLTAAQFAKDYGIRVYTIGAGTGSEVYLPERNLFGERLVPAHLPIDEDTLREIASLTDGRFYRATDLESLRGAYEEINKLERTEIDVGDYYEYEEGFMPWALLGAAFVGASVFGRRFWFEPIP